MLKKKKGGTALQIVSAFSQFVFDMYAAKLHLRHSGVICIYKGVINCFII